MMDDDAILKQLGGRVRAQEAEAAEAAPDGLPAFDTAAEERIAARLLGNPSTSTSTSTNANVVRPMRWLWAAMPLAAAAAFLLYIMTRSAGGEAPAYELSLVSASEMRAPVAAKPDAEVVVDPEGELELIARPLAPVKGVHARAFLTRMGDTTAWTVPIDVSDEGAVKISGASRSLFPATTGTYGIAILLGFGGDTPSDSEAKTLVSGDARASNTGKYRLIRAQIRFADKK